MIIEPYKDLFGIESPSELAQKFLGTTAETARGHKFYVNWNKIKQNVASKRIELNILSTLISSKNFDEDLRAILRRYPEVLPLFPLLIAVRSIEITILNDYEGVQTPQTYYDFSEHSLSIDEIEKIVVFATQTGLRLFFTEMVHQSLWDYLLGVEVGLDTHARKNRSGMAGELALATLLRTIGSARIETKYQTYFRELRKLGFTVSPTLENRKSDALVIVDNSFVVNIEVNFYDGSGSKPSELVDGYIKRQSDLKAAGFGFIWLTDGRGWHEMTNSLGIAAQEIDYLMNFYLANEGLLERVLLGE